MLSARSSAVRRRLGDDEKVSIEYIEASGDCFYLALEAALSEEDGWCPYYAVATMRDVVASKMTEETYQMYALMHDQQAEGVLLTHHTTGTRHCSSATWQVRPRRTPRRVC